MKEGLYYDEKMRLYFKIIENLKKKKRNLFVSSLWNK